MSPHNSRFDGVYEPQSSVIVRRANSALSLLGPLPIPCEPHVCASVNRICAIYMLAVIASAYVLIYIM